VLRRAELVEIIEQAPASIAQLRELWVRSETTASERKLREAIRAREAAEVELVEVDESLAIVDRLLGEQLAREQQEAREKLEARLGEFRSGQADAFQACADKFAELFELWKAFAFSQEQLQSLWWSSPGREGVRPGMVCDPSPINFQALLGILYRASLRREDVGYQTIERVAHLVADLGRDVPLELSGQGVQALRTF
jgi:hypothetical protein